MNLEFRHEVKGVWGWYEVCEHCWDTDDDVLKMIFRELRKDRSAVLFIMDVSTIVDHDNILNVSLSWDSWDEYDNNIITVTVWTNWNSRTYHKMKWDKGKKIFKKIINMGHENLVVKVKDVF